MRNAADMAEVGSAASPYHAQPGQELGKFAMQLAKFARIALVELLGIVELGMAQARSIGTNSANPFDPAIAIDKRVTEMIRMGAIDHEIGWITIGRLVDLADRHTK